VQPPSLKSSDKLFTADDFPRAKVSDPTKIVCARWEQQQTKDPQSSKPPLKKKMRLKTDVLAVFF
jgi:hypothetical protein